MLEFINGPCCWNRTAPSRLRRQAPEGASTWCDYSTARYLGGSDPRIVHTVEFPELDFHSGIQFELPCDENFDRWNRIGLQFATEEDLRDIGFQELFVRSLDLVRAVGPILGTIAGLCRSVHVLIPCDAHFDSSFSDPVLPFSIFVSCPFTKEPNRVERMAENIVHEALHLQLSLVEKSQPLVTEVPDQQRMFSPWKKEHRPVQGLVHGVYVFGNLMHFWKCISKHNTEYSSFAEERIEVIDGELASARGLETDPILTMSGRHLVRSLLESR